MAVIKVFLSILDVSVNASNPLTLIFAHTSAISLNLPASCLKRGNDVKRNEEKIRLTVSMAMID